MKRLRCLAWFVGFVAVWVVMLIFTAWACFRLFPLATERLLSWIR